MKPSEMIKSGIPTMYERFGKKTPDIKKNIKHKLKLIRDIRTSNTVTKNRGMISDVKSSKSGANKGMIRDDVDASGLYQLISELKNELPTFPTSLAKLHGDVNLTQTPQTRTKKVQKHLTSALIPKPYPHKGNPTWQNLKGGT